MVLSFFLRFISKLLFDCYKHIKVQDHFNGYFYSILTDWLHLVSFEICYRKLLPLQGITLYSHADDFSLPLIRYVLAERSKSNTHLVFK